MLDLVDIALITALGASVAEGASRWRRWKAAKRTHGGSVNLNAPQTPTAPNTPPATASMTTPMTTPMTAAATADDQLYANALETLPIGIALFDSQKNLAHVNRRVYSLLGVEPEQLTPETTLEGILKLVVATGKTSRDEAQEIAAGHVRLLAHLSPQTIVTNRRDGRVIQIQLNRLDNDAVSATFEDAGARQMAEAALKHSEERFRDFAETSADWHWEADLDGRFTYLTPPHRTIAGIPASALVGCVWHDLFPLLGADRNAVARVAEMIANHEPFTGIEIPAKGIDGSQVWIQVSGRPIYSDRGVLIACRGSGTDITPQKMAEAAVRKATSELDVAYRAKSQFLANMSHELRTPLNAIIGFSDMIRSEIAGTISNRTYVQYASDIHEAGEHLLSLINDILDMSKIETRAMEIDEQSVDIARVIHAAIRIIYGRGEQNQAPLVVNLPPSMPTLIADELRMKQVILNLLANAIKFSPPESKVTIDIDASPVHGLVMKIIDQGIGIAPEDIPIALMPFGQVRGSSRHRSEGTGLGLPLSKSFIELHGGTIGIESERGKGTTVIVTLPPSRLRWVTPGQTGAEPPPDDLRQTG